MLCPLSIFNLIVCIAIVSYFFLAFVFVCFLHIILILVVVGLKKKIIWMNSLDKKNYLFLFQIKFVLFLPFFIVASQFITVTLFLLVYATSYY